MEMINSNLEGLYQLFAGTLLFSCLSAAVGAGVYALFNYRQRHK